jgi:hypothetical protein
MKGSKDQKIFEQVMNECNGSADKVNLTKLKNFAERYVKEHPGGLDMDAISSMSPKTARKAILDYFCKLNKMPIQKPIQKQPVGCEAPEKVKQVTPTKQVIAPVKQASLKSTVKMKNVGKPPSVTIESNTGRYICSCMKLEKN